jgi:hypothetical protein
VCAIHPIPGHELDKEKYSCEKKGKRYERVGYAKIKRSPLEVVKWPKEKETIILV